MIEMDPDTEYFFELANSETMFPVSINCTIYFG